MAYISGYERRPSEVKQGYQDWRIGQHSKEFTVTLDNGNVSVRLDDQYDYDFYLQFSFPVDAAKALALALLSVAEGAASKVMGTFLEEGE